jgi:hypothetical protein
MPPPHVSALAAWIVWPSCTFDMFERALDPELAGAIHQL